MTGERLVLLSDLHLGGGAEAAGWGPGFADEFDGDDAFPEFLAYLSTRDDPPDRLVLLGDTVDFLRVPVSGSRAGLYARTDAEAVGQLDRVALAHPRVFAALAEALRAGVAIDVVVGNHDLELARSAVRDRLRALLLPAGSAAAAGRLRVHRWGYHLPGLLYAEHGNHFHDINTVHRPLQPFRRGGSVERPPAARLGGLRRVALRGPARSLARDAVSDLLPRHHPDRAARRAYLAGALPGYAAGLGLPADTVLRLHEMGRASPARTVRRLVRAGLAGGPAFAEQLPAVAAAVHEILGAAGRGAAFYVFGHAHEARHARLPGTAACYLNTGTWSTDVRGTREGPEPARRTWVEILPGQGGRPAAAALLRWAGGPVALPGPVDRDERPAVRDRS